MPTALLTSIAVLFALSPWGSPPLALLLGIILASVVEPKAPKEISRITRLLLQTSVVGLGFGVELGKVLAVSRDGFVLSVSTIVGTLLGGYLLAKALGVGSRIAYLISCGTAICGGSAIAAVAPVIEAKEEEIAVALGTVFTLNAVALFVFPVIGAAMHLSAPQFGLWSAVAIHDTSSVVGAASRFGDEALQIATTVKLGRALFIVPLTFVTAILFGRKAGWAAVPVFIVLFFIAVTLRSFMPSAASSFGPLVAAAKVGLAATLFLIGAGFSPRKIMQVGARPLLLGVLLWFAVSGTTLFMVQP